MLTLKTVKLKEQDVCLDYLWCMHSESTGGWLHALGAAPCKVMHILAIPVVYVCVPQFLDNSPSGHGAGGLDPWPAIGYMPLSSTCCLPFLPIDSNRYQIVDSHIV